MDIKQSNDKFYVGDNPEKPLAEITFVRNGTKQLIIDHTMVGEELRGKGVGDMLLAKVIKYARENHRQIVPLCTFAKARLEGDKDQYEDVLNKK